MNGSVTVGRRFRNSMKYGSVVIIIIAENCYYVLEPCEGNDHFDMCLVHAVQSSGIHRYFTAITNHDAVII